MGLVRLNYVIRLTHRGFDRGRILILKDHKRAGLNHGFYVNTLRRTGVLTQGCFGLCWPSGMRAERVGPVVARTVLPSLM
jgi:hypothetical protein